MTASMRWASPPVAVGDGLGTPLVKGLVGKPSTGRDTATGIPSAAESKNSGNLIFKAFAARRTTRPGEKIRSSAQAADCTATALATPTPQPSSHWAGRRP